MESLKIKELIGQTQTDCKGLGSSTAKWWSWSRAEGKEKRDMVINEIGLNEGFRKQSNNLNRNNGLTGIMPCRNPLWNEIWRMVPLHINFLIRSVYDLLPLKSNLVRWGKKEDPTSPLCQGRQTREHVLNSCKFALSQGRYTWRHNGVLQELAAIISTAKGVTNLPKTNALIFTTEGGTKSSHGTEGR